MMEYGNHINTKGIDMLCKNIDMIVDDSQFDTLELKKKGRPQSIHYVKESDLRTEIDIAQRNKITAIQSIAAAWDVKIASASTEPEKDALSLERTKAIAVAETKTYCAHRLGEIVVLTVDRVATQTKFRRYTYLDDMKAEAIYQSIKGITKFDLNNTNKLGQKSSSFSYLTQIITNAFRQILKKEKKHREIKDQAIEIAIDECNNDTNFDSIRRKRESTDGYM